MGLLEPMGAAYLWSLDHDPGTSETVDFGPSLSVGDEVYSTASLNYFRCLNNTYGSQSWDKLITASNISSSIPTNAWSLSSISLAFNTARTPSSTNNITVCASFSQSSTVLGSSTVNAQILISSTWTTISTSSLSGLLTTQINSITFDVPKGMQYKLISASGTNAVSSIFETKK